LYTKAHANEINYLAFMVITFVIAWIVLGKLGVYITMVYFIVKTKFVKKQLPKFSNKKFASAAIIISTLILFGGIFGFVEFIQSMIKHSMA
jgi:membrane fusion protein (multidrug efflux system)